MQDSEEQLGEALNEIREIKQPGQLFFLTRS
jgi:hypothetical protein